MLKAGTGTQVINPPIGTSLGGYFHDRVSTAIHDDLLAKALVLDDGATQVAIVVCDILRVMRREVEKARELASAATGIPAANIMISATHTHTGPETHPNKQVPVNESYLAELPQMIADSVIRAHADLCPASLRLGEEYEDRIAFNRRFRMADGSVVFNPPKQAEGIIGPDGPTDPQLNVLRVDGEDAKPVAIIANYAMHPDVMGGSEISADFPGGTSRIASSLYESQPMVVYMQGACGNINQRDIFDPANQKGPEEVTRLSRVLAGKIVAASETAVPIVGEPLGVCTRILEILYHPLTDELRAKAAETLKLPNPGTFERVQAERIESYQLDGKTASVEVQTIGVGETAFVGVPGEYFVEYGLSIKEWSPFAQTFIAELANGTFGYIPTQDAFFPGTYETMPILSATLEPSAGVRIANAAGQLLRDLAK